MKKKKERGVPAARSSNVCSYAVALTAALVAIIVAAVRLTTLAASEVQTSAPEGEATVEHLPKEPTALERLPKEPTTPQEASAASDAACVDLDARCMSWKQRGECGQNPSFMLQSCAKSCDACAAASSEQQPANEHPRTTTAQPTLRSPDPSCTDGNPGCPSWARSGECDSACLGHEPRAIVA